MTILDTLITDRSQEDVELARALAAKGWDHMTKAERTAYSAGLKGAYGPTDMNRVRLAMEYIDRLMTDAKRESVYQPVPISHAEYNGASWRRWSDVVCVASDYAGPDIYLPNINRMWEAARRFKAAAQARYDPYGNGYIATSDEVDAGKLFTVTDCFGIAELRVTAVCPPEVTAQGAAWTVEQTEDGWTAALDFPAGPFPYLEDALKALKISCSEDSSAEGVFTLSATLRYDYNVAGGACAVRWKPCRPYVPADSAGYMTVDGEDYYVWGDKNGSV